LSLSSVLVKSREMTGGTQTLPGWLGEKGEDDRKQKCIGPIAYRIYRTIQSVYVASPWSTKMIGNSLNLPLFPTIYTAILHEYTSIL
jgi:hypothetical protein